MTSAFERLLADPSEAEVDYILVGVLAVALCGHVRATEELELMVTTQCVNDPMILHLNIGIDHPRERIAPAKRTRWTVKPFVVFRKRGTSNTERRLK